MDKRTLTLRAEARKKKRELAEKRENERKEQAQKALKLAGYFRRIVRRADYKQLINVFKEKKEALTQACVKPNLNLIETERLRGQIELLDMIINMPKDFFEGEDIIRKIYPELIKEE